jgi:hypothetical protein
MTERSRIDAELDGVRVSPDGSRLILLLREAAGQKVALSLPTSCVGEVLAAAPHQAEGHTVHSVATWNMSPAGNGRDMVLTLCTPEGIVMSFTIQSWQAQGMATIATYGAARDSSSRTSRSVH